MNANDIEEQLTGERSGKQRPRPPVTRSATAAVKIVRTLITQQKRVDRYEATERVWWLAHTRRMAGADLGPARAGWADAVQHIRHGQALQCITAALHPGVVQQVLGLAKKHLSDDQAHLVISGASTLEADVLDRLWAVAREGASADGFLNSFGFYGPNAGELASPSWRHDYGTLHNTLESYRALDESRSPKAMIAARHRDAQMARQALLEKLSKPAAFSIGRLINMAERMTALREKGKTLMLMGADAARASAGRAGVLLAEGGAITEPSDIYFLTADEMNSASPTGSYKPLVVERKTQRDAYQRIVMPINFNGNELHTIVTDQLSAVGAEAAANGAAQAHVLLTGEGVSSGVYTGIARVILDPYDADLAPGDVLVCSTTDPGWAPIMMLAGAIVLDMGSALSHGDRCSRTGYSLRGKHRQCNHHHRRRDDNHRRRICRHRRINIVRRRVDRHPQLSAPAVRKT